MNYRVRPLGCFNRLFQSYLAALVLRVRNNDNCFAPGLRSEFFAARQVDRVIESCTGDLPRSDWAGISYPGSLIRDVDPALVNGAFQLATLVGEIRQQIDIGIERHHQSFITLADDTCYELAACVLDGR